jgi:hypothetical protein
MSGNLWVMQSSVIHAVTQESYTTYLLTYSLTHSLHGTEYYLKSCHSTFKKISYFPYLTRRIITVFTKAHHWTLSWTSRIHFAPSIPVSLKSSLMLSSYLCLVPPSGLYPVNTFPLLHACHTPSPPHPPSFNQPLSSSLCSFLHDPFSSRLGPNIFLNRGLVSSSLNFCL